MSNKSRRRVKLAAGAILAGAAIPITAASAAWADTTETLQQLENQGLSPDQAQAVVTAEGNGTPVEVSYDGKIVVDANQGATTADQATATSGRNDVSAAIGDGTNSTSHGAGAVAFSDGTNDDATARGKDATVSITDDSSNTGATGGNSATAKGLHADANAYGDSGAHESAKGFGAYADAEEAANTTVAASGKGSNAEAYNDVNGSTVTAAGHGASAYADNTVSDSSVTATGTRSYAEAADNDSSVTVTATGRGTDAYAYDSTNGSATARDTSLGGGGQRVAFDDVIGVRGGFNGYAKIDYTTNSDAFARGLGSQAEVLGTSGSPVVDSSAVDTNGTNTTVYTSDTHLENGMVAPPGDMHMPLLP